MRIIRTVLLLVLSASLISACSSMPAKQQEPEVNADGNPTWLTDPKNGAVGFAYTHANGVVAQEEMAAMRAREEFARRYGVSVSAVQDMTREVSNGHSSTQAKTVSHQETNQSNIKCYIKAKWHNVEKGLLYVWVVPFN